MIRHIAIVASTSGKEYDIYHNAGERPSLSCSCPHWSYRLRKSHEDCKHIEEFLSKWSVNFALSVPPGHPIFVQMEQQEE